MNATSNDQAKGEELDEGCKECQRAQRLINVEKVLFGTLDICGELVTLRQLQC